MKTEYVLRVVVPDKALRDEYAELVSNAYPKSWAEYLAEMGESMADDLKAGWCAIESVAVEAGPEEVERG